MRTAIISGSTGLVGKSLLQKLLEDPFYDRVVSVGRRRTKVDHGKLSEVIVDFDRLQDHRHELKGDDVFCCLGTTMKKAGSKEAFWKVDHDYPFDLARHTYENGAERFFLVSALGADAGSSIYYNQVKGKVEEAIGAIPFNAYHVFRPSLLLGPREEERSGEDAAKMFYRIFNFLIPLKYKAIPAETVAAAMLQSAKKNDQGKLIHLSAEMRQLQK